MEVIKKWKKNIIRRCKSIKEKKQTSSTDLTMLPKCKSYPPWCSPITIPSPSPASPRSSKRQATPGGCFSVYVGSERQRFVMKAKYANHHLFKMLLDDAKELYGYKNQSPIFLPCEVDYFYKVLSEMDSESTDVITSPFCGSYGAYSLLSPSRLIKMNNF